MKSFYYEDGSVMLKGDSVDFKIDSNRKIYVRYHNKTKKFQYIGHQVPYGMSKEDKEIYLIELRKRVMEVKSNQTHQSDEESKEVENNGNEL